MKKELSFFLAIIILFSMVLITPLNTEAVGNFPVGAIADEAEKYPDNTNGGQCITFVKNVVHTASGGIMTVPPGYQNAFAQYGIEISKENAVRGDIIQITPAGSLNDDANAPNYYDNTKSNSRLHTMIILSNNGNGNFYVIHSNYVGYEIVGRSNLNPYTWASGSIIKIWRLGTYSSSAPSLSSPFNDAVIELNTSKNFSWSNTGASRYKIRFINNSGSGTTDINVNGTNINFTPNSAGNWIWKVCEFPDTGIEGAYSTERSFTVPGTPPPQPSNNIKYEYYNDDLLRFGVVHTDYETGDNINKNWGTGSPDGSVRSDYFSALITGQFNINQGWYKFHYEVDDSIKVKIDGTSFIDNNGGGSSDVIREVGFSGEHTIIIEYGERQGDAKIVLNWTRVSAPAVPNAPTGLYSPSHTDTTVNLSWNSVSDVTGYNVYEGSVKINSSLITGTSYTVTNLSQNTYHQFTVKAVNSIGESEGSIYTGVTTNYTIPNAPTGLYSPGYTDTAVDLSWNAVSNADGYNVYKDSIKINSSLIYSTAFTITRLNQNTQYNFTVKAVNPGGESAASNVVSITTNITPTVPGVPTGLYSPGKTNTTVDLSWNAVPGVTGYHVYCGTAKITSTPITSTVYTVTGLTQNTAYDFSIKAVNEVGESEASQILSITTDSEDFTYTISDSAAEITGYTGAGGDVIIPDTMGGYPVTCIGEYAFDGCTGLTGIIIPDGVTTIESYAFRSCTGLTSINISESVTTVSELAFFGCMAITNINVQVGNTVYKSEYNCLIETAANKLTLGCKTSIIPDYVTNIGTRAFMYCSGLTSIIIPDNVAIIGDWAFDRCTALTSIIIPDSVSTIGNFAFAWCTGLTNINIPDSVITIGERAFVDCGNMTSYSVSSLNPNYSSNEDGALFNIDKSILIQYPIGKTQPSYSIPDSVVTVGKYAFFSSTFLTDINIPDNVIAIENYAFGSCIGLTSINIPVNITTIGSGAFYNCSGLTSITFNSPTTIIYDAANTISTVAKIIGYDPSTAKDYALKYGRIFEVIASSEKDIDFNFQGVSIKLIEPWGLRFYTQVSGSDFNTGLSFGTVVLHQNYYTAGMTAEEMMADPNAIVLTSESGDSVLDESSRIVGTMVSGIYTYSMNTSYYTAAYVVINGEYIFSPVNSRNIYDRVVYLKDNSTDIYVKPIYQEMYNLYTDVKSYHDSLGTVTIPEPQIIKRGSECLPGTVAADSSLVAYSFKGVSIRLIEPWGLCFYTEMIIPNSGSVTEFGTVVLPQDDYGIGMTGEEMRLAANSYVFNSADGTAVYDISNRIVAKLVDGIYTYNMDKTFYTVSYAIIGGEYYYSDVNCRCMYDRVSLLKDTSSDVYVKEIYASMYSLYGAVEAYHVYLGLKVIPIRATGISLNQTSLSLVMGETATLTATIVPSDATDKKVIWTTDNANVVSVSGNGNISAGSVGTATITVRTSNGLSAACTVNVSSDNSEMSFEYQTSWTTGGDSEEMAVDSIGNIYVTDSLNSCVKKYTQSGEFIKSWGNNGTGDGQFGASICGIAVDAQDNIIVSDSYNNRLQKFTSDGVFITKGYGNFSYPKGLAIDSAGYIYAVSEWNNTIKKFTSDLVYVTEWGSFGSGNGCFDYPDDIAIDSNDYIYIIDDYDGSHYGNCVQKFTTNGDFIAKWGSLGSDDGMFNHAQGIAADSNNNIFVTDQENDRIVIYDSNGNFLQNWGSYGSVFGQFDGPNDIITWNGHICISEYGNDKRIQVFSIEIFSGFSLSKLTFCNSSDSDNCIIDEDGGIRNIQSSPTSDIDALINNTEGADYDATFHIQYLTEWDSVCAGYGIYYRAVRNSDGTTNGYTFHFDPGLSNSFAVSKSHNSAGSVFQLIDFISVMGSDFDRFALHTITISVKGNHHVIKCDDTVVFDFIDDEFSNGSLGIRAWGYSTSKFYDYMQEAT